MPAEQKRLHKPNEGSEPTRSDDVYVKLPSNWPFVGGFELSVSGRILVLLVIAIVIGGGLFLHDWKADRDHSTLEQLQTVQTCVLTLSEEQKQDYRKYGSYCWTQGHPLPFFVGRDK